MLNKNNAKNILQDLQDGLSPEELAAGIQDHGRNVLEEEIHYLIGSNAPKEYAYIRDAAEEVLKIGSKMEETDVTFAEIENTHIRQRLQRALVTFGAVEFYGAADKIYDEKVEAILARNLRGIMRTAPLKELKFWVLPQNDTIGKSYYEIAYDLIKNPEAKKLVQELATLYSARRVGRRIADERKNLEGERIAALVEAQAVPLDTVKAFIRAQKSATAQHAPTYSRND